MTVSAAGAQTPESTPEPPIDEDTPGESPGPTHHIVEEGETLYTIAEGYGTTVEALQLLNNIDDPSLIYVGQELTLPGGNGGAVTTMYTVQLGDTLPSLAYYFKTTTAEIASDNNLINGDKLTAGLPLIIVSKTGSQEPEILLGSPHIVAPGDTLLTLAAQYGLASEEIVAANALPYPAYLFPGQRLRIPVDNPYQFLSGTWRRLKLSPLPLVLGNSAVVFVSSSLDSSEPTGYLAGQELHFATFGDGYVALVGFDAFTEPGTYLIEISDGGTSTETTTQDVVINAFDFGTQYITIPNDKVDLLAPEIRQNEDQFLATVYDSFTTEPLWDNQLTLPVTDTVVTAPYGGARSYNDGPIEIYHTGIDFSGGIGTKIITPAPGKVVLSDTLTLRGNTLILDHGLGLMSGYYHLSKILVQEGDLVSAGQVIAEGGSTGLSSGPHLHWDLRIHNVPVDPLQWTNQDLLEEAFRPFSQPDG